MDLLTPIARVLWGVAQCVLWAALGLLIILVAGCGGGVGGGQTYLPSNIPAEKTPQPASALQFAYYGAVTGMIPQVADHVTAVMVPPWVDDQTPYFREAHAAGKKIIWYPKPAPDVYQQAVYLDSLGLLSNILAVYPCDEPDINPCPDPAPLRPLLAVFPALATAKLAVIYSASGRFPGIEAYDWVGVDDYAQGVGILGTNIANLRLRLAPHQRLILVPGGADPWRTPPMPFLTYALSDSRVAMIMPFVWFDRAGPDGGKGIGTNGMAEQYRAVGRAILQ